MKTTKSILLDTDVIVNWLSKETETTSKKALWKAPFEIISHIEEGRFKGFMSLTSILEIRFLMRRKKGVSEHEVNTDLQKLTELFEILIIDEIALLRANKLQAKYPLDPFDAILLSLSLGMPEAVLVSRDSKFLKIAGQLIEATTPEEALNLLPKT